MADVVYLVLALGVFGLCAAYVRGLDRLVRASSAQEVPREVKQ